MQKATPQDPVGSDGLLPNDDGPLDQGSNEVQFALVIARMIDTVEHSPEHLRQAVYDLARYKLREQITSTDEEDIKRSQLALEAAIRGVEDFSRQQFALAPPQVPRLQDGSGAARSLPGADPARRRRPATSIDPISAVRNKLLDPLSPLAMRTVAVLLIVGAAVVVIQQRHRLASWVQHGSQLQEQAAVPVQQRAPVAAVAAAAPVPPPKPNPLRPTDYGVYAIEGESLAEMELLPGRPPDIRVAVSAALRTPSHTMLSSGHPKFIVFRHDAAPERAEVRVIAKVAREFSAEVAGKRPEDGDSWVIRNVTFPFRVSPLPDNPEMYELHSEDPALELTPGRYALIIKNQAYDFTVDGAVSDPKHCIERILATNGTFYSDCKRP